MTVIDTAARVADGCGGREIGRAAPSRGTFEAVLLASAAFEDGPTAALPLAGGTVLGRLLAQLDGLGAGVVHVVARPEMLEDVAGRHESAGTAQDLQVVAGIARAATGPLLVACGDLVAHREALAGLLGDPALDTAVLAAGPAGRPFGTRIRFNRGRVVSAGSAYHRVRRPNGRYLGALRVAGGDRDALAAVAERLAVLVAAPPEDWRRELDAKTVAWRRWLARRAAPDVDAPAVTHADAAALERQRAAAAGDAGSLLLVGLVRSGVRVGVSHLRRLSCTRPLTREAAERAAERLAATDERRQLLASAVKRGDGFFTTFFVSPYSKYIARWAAERGLTPNQVTTLSLLLGFAAATAFALGTRAGLVTGAVLLQISFTTDCVDGQLARYSRQFSKLGAWMDATFDRTKEYAVFAGLALGSTRAATTRGCWPAPRWRCRRSATRCSSPTAPPANARSAPRRSCHSNRAPTRRVCAPHPRPSNAVRSPPHCAGHARSVASRERRGPAGSSCSRSASGSP